MHFLNQLIVIPILYKRKINYSFFHWMKKKNIKKSEFLKKYFLSEWVVVLCTYNFFYFVFFFFVSWFKYVCNLLTSMYYGKLWKEFKFLLDVEIVLVVVVEVKDLEHVLGFEEAHVVVVAEMVVVMDVHQVQDFQLEKAHPVAMISQDQDTNSKIIL